MTPAQNRLTLAGNLPAVPTPFNTRGDLMIDAFAEVVRWYLSTSVNGICIAGDNGEAWSLTLEERRQLAETAVRESGGRVPVIMGTSAVTARQSIAFGEVAANAGVDALLLQPQGYVLKATHAELVNRYRTIAAALPLPVVVYNSPRRTGVNIDVQTLAAICEVAEVVAIKESSRDFFHTTHVIERFADRLAVLIGPAPYIFPGVALGAAGFISTGPEFIGSDRSRILHLAQQAPSHESKRLHFALTGIYEALMQTGTWPAAFKAALNMLGVPAGLPREPVSPLDAAGEGTVRMALQEAGVLAAEAGAR